MVAGDRLTRRFIGGIILITLFFSLGLTWNFWFIEEPLSTKEVSDNLPFVLSTDTVVLKVGQIGYVSIVPRRAIKKAVHLHIELDDPLLIDTLSSVTLHPGSSRAVFIPINSHTAGKCFMTFVSDSDELPELNNVKIEIKIVRHVSFGHLSLLLGWSYFLCWSLSYYPQLYENWRRRSVVGLSFDWLSLNFSSHVCYCLFNIAMCYNTAVQAEYRSLHPHGVIPVKPNDSFFSLHAVLMNVILVLQCVFFERADQRLSMPMGSFVSGLWGIVFLGLLAGLVEKVSWLQYLYFLSFIKVISTPIKLTPQVYFNYIRKSTDGWSIYMVTLDFAGGVLGLMQMVVDAYNYDDWAGAFGNPSKIGLGLLTMSYDIVFMIQHFVLYKKKFPRAIPARKRKTTDEFQKKLNDLTTNMASKASYSSSAKTSGNIYEV